MVLGRFVLIDRRDAVIPLNSMTRHRWKFSQHTSGPPEPEPLDNFYQEGVLDRTARDFGDYMGVGALIITLAASKFFKTR